MDLVDFAVRASLRHFSYFRNLDGPAI